MCTSIIGFDDILIHFSIQVIGTAVIGNFCEKKKVLKISK